MAVKRRTAGLYDVTDTAGETWTVSATEGEQRAPGYHWSAHHSDKGEHFFGKYREAVAFVTDHA